MAVRRVFFYEHSFLVPEDVFSPRPETEILVEVARDYIKEFIYDIARNREEYKVRRKSLKDEKNDNKKIVVADVGTGSGCIIISLERELWKYIKAFELPFIFVGIDISEKAVKTAFENAKNIGSKSFFVRGDTLSPLKYADFVISNPPYVSLKVKDKIKVDDPPSSLFGGEEGYEFTLKLISESAIKLRFGGYLFIEVGYDDLRFFNLRESGEKAKRIIFSHSQRWFYIYPPIKDYKKIERILVMRKVREPE